MAGAQQQIRQAVEGIETWLAHSPHPGEAIVRQAIVLRLLHAAGFDIWNPAEVVPEETNATGHRSDFLIRAGSGKFALEIKGMNIMLGAQQFQQASTYAVNEGTRWAIVTNGRVWIAIDEHLPGKWEQRVALKLELGQEGQTFSDDLAALLDAEMWRADGFAGAVQVIRSRQQQRLDEARIRREKTAVVQEIQVKYGISTFALAADAAVRMNELTEAERDVLLGAPAVKTLPPIPSKKVGRQTSTPMLQPFQSKPTPDDSAQEIHFTYRFNRAKADAIYRPDEGTWTVKAGSTCILEGKSYAKTAHDRRGQLLAEGKLIKQDDYLVYAVDVVYQTPSAAADDISGASKNGWDVWKDDQDRPAQYHRPKPQPI